MLCASAQQDHQHTNNLSSFYCEDQGFHPELGPASLTQLVALLFSERAEDTLAPQCPSDVLRSWAEPGQAWKEGWKEGPTGLLPTEKRDDSSIGDKCFVSSYLTVLIPAHRA